MEGLQTIRDYNRLGRESGGRQSIEWNIPRGVRGTGASGGGWAYTAYSLTGGYDKKIGNSNSWENDKVGLEKRHREDREGATAETPQFTLQSSKLGKRMAGR